MFLAPIALFVDCLVGDPQWITHPVILQGRLITYLENKLYRPTYSPLCLKILGAVVVFLTVGGVWITTWLAVSLTRRIHPLFGALVAIWLASTTIAQKGLAMAALPIAKALDEKDIPLAQTLTGQIVGRDTRQLNGHEFTRATIETVAENTVDAITAPLFYALLGGAPLAMAYRAANTLDSMLGYKNERYLDFGFAAARFDDIVNYIPARLSGLLLPLAARFCGLNTKGSWEIMKRDAKKHPSPNSGILEAGFAGAMDITLGGKNVYGEVVSLRALLGDKQVSLLPEHILTAVQLMKVLAGLFVVLVIILALMRWI